MNWEKIYREILEDFGFSEEKDIKSARILERLSKNTSEVYNKLKEKLVGER